MPQLNPDPWFYIMFLSWLAVLIILPLKISPLAHLNNPSNFQTDQTNTKHWAWPWT
uniref:ATP synthase complex subunit 8 n=1 Tax=Leptobrachella oshanensis TaxID=2769484 RepID=M1RM60_LEPOH|nr:ATP synthase F0 subunit 8 [Leptobrachella oshanensis]AGG15984.1 ATP synthase F0 subunit 8 [Leptobrachella oshanensis]